MAFTVKDASGALSFKPRDGMIERYVRQQGVRPQEALRLFEELKKFLCIAAAIQQVEASQRQSPPDRIDKMWHHFIFDDTEAYLDYCTTYLGIVVHHRAGEIAPRGPVVEEVVKALGLKLDDPLWTEPDADCC